MKEIFHKVDMDSCYEYVNLCNIELLKTKIMEYCENDWTGKITSLPKLRTYITIKHKYETELYVKMNIKKQERSVMAQFRCGILSLRIETGRFRNEAPDERFCTFCDDGSVEDEKHFLLYCKAYHNLRQLLFESVNLDRHFIYNRTFANLMTLHQRQTAKYLNLFFCKRKELLYK